MELGFNIQRGIDLYSREGEEEHRGPKTRIWVFKITYKLWNSLPAVYKVYTHF